MQLTGNHSVAIILREFSTHTRNTRFTRFAEIATLHLADLAEAFEFLASKLLNTRVFRQTSSKVKAIELR